MMAMGYTVALRGGPCLDLDAARKVNVFAREWFTETSRLW